MDLSKKVNTYFGKEIYMNFETTNHCPVCHKNIIPKYISAFVDSHETATIFNYCVGCNNSFISRYRVSRYDGTSVRNSARISITFNRSYPLIQKKRVFDEKISLMSINFPKIYNQASKAESDNLDEIAGMGYRKSLEILMKDYAIYLNPDKKEDILDPKYSLSKCIEDYIKADNLKDVSKIASWIGNDETHYTKVHTDKDINDLKEYLDATIYFIMYDLVAKKAFEAINT